MKAGKGRERRYKISRLESQHLDGPEPVIQGADKQTPSNTLCERVIERGEEPQPQTQRTMTRQDTRLRILAEEGDERAVRRRTRGWAMRMRDNGLDGIDGAALISQNPGTSAA